MMLVVHNSKSGQQSSLTDIKQAMQAHGIEAEYVAITAHNLQRKVTDFAKRKDAVVVAAGGDGTISAVSGMIQGTKAKLGILPAGTLNHFARELGVPAEIPEAVAVLAAGRVELVDVASVNDRVFINNSSIGWYPRSLHARDELEGKVGKWPAALAGSLRAAVRPRRYRVELVIDGRAHVYRTPFVFIGNNAYKRDPTGLGQRESLQNGQIAIYVVKAQSALGVLRMLGHAMLTRKARSQDFAIHLTTECAIHTKRHRQLSVATDGEVTQLDTPLHYRSHPKTLRVIVP
jgi:diacylglycerol kinase family enzyme